MSNISNLSGYYPLNNPGGLPNSQQASTPTDALLQAMSSMGSGDNAAQSSDAFLLDLSPQAQQLVNNSGAASAASLFGSNFVLSAQQQQQISAILAKYKDAPYTQDTFNQIQNDLQSAGLGPDILSMKDQAQSFDPALVLIDALNGTSTDSTGVLGGGANAQGKSSSYMAGIIRQWQNISTTYQATAANTAGA